MPDLPPLPERVQRKLVLQWQELLETHGFTGAHLNWKLQVSKAPPPPTILGSSYRPRQTVSASLKKERDLAAKRVGVEQTVRLAKARFTQLEAEYFALWSERETNSDSFAVQLHGIRSLVVVEIGRLWEQRGDWFAVYAGLKLRRL